MSHSYAALFEQANDGGWSAHVPDLPSILVGADTREEAEGLMREAIVLHLEDLKEQGIAAPASATYAAQIEVAA